MTGLNLPGWVVEAHHPWPHTVIDEQTWRLACAQLATGAWTLAGLWGEASCVHMAVRGDGDDPAMEILTLLCPAGQYPSVGRVHLPAIRLERAVRDLFGLDPVGLPDGRPWLDHGVWGVQSPLGREPKAGVAAGPYEFLPVEGEDLHQLAVGPVHAGIIEPGHFRFSADGETVVRLEQRFGYAHKGVEGLLQGCEVMHGARIAGRVSGDSTVAYAYAYARAVETALGVDVPPRAVWLRALMAELERLANHLGDVGAICNDAAFAIMLAHCGILRERLLRTCVPCFGHRLMMDRIVPGGVAGAWDPEKSALVRSAIGAIRTGFRPLAGLYDKTASIQDRTVGAGIVRPELAQRFGCGGVIGRASGRAFDARQSVGYPPYPALRFDVPVLQAGDINARVWIRISEIDQSLALVEQILDGLPEGSLQAELPPGRGGEGVALVESFRGDILAWVRIESGGTLERCHLRDPSWFQWPLLEIAIEGNIAADFPLCNKSFNCSYSGHDL
jgi:Ni,Fe-hydrogenase III large subunit